MTHDGEKWLDKLAIQSNGLICPTKDEIDYVLRAFIAEVEKMAAALDGGSTNGPSPAIYYKLIDLAREEAIGQAFDDLTREMIGGGSAKP